MTIGRDGDRTRFGDQPDNVRIEDFVPQERLLPAVDVVVCHGGSATVLGALAHGVPLVVAPLATDHFEVAAHVRDAHVGLATGSGEPPEADIRDAVRTVLGDPSFRTSAAATANRSPSCRRRRRSWTGSAPALAHPEHGCRTIKNRTISGDNPRPAPSRHAFRRGFDSCLGCVGDRPGSRHR